LVGVLGKGRGNPSRTWAQSWEFIDMLGGCN
jgi:hypothetical protein